MNKMLYWFISLVVLSLFHDGLPNEFSPNPDMPRSQVPNVYKWDVSHVFKTKEDWQNAYQEVELKMEVLAQECKGKLNTSAAKFLECYEAFNNLYEELDRVDSYAYLNSVIDRSDIARQVDHKNAELLRNRFDEKISFFNREIIEEVREEGIGRFYAEEPSLCNYQYALDEIFRRKNHILSEEKQKTEAKFEEIFAGTYEMYDTIFDNLKWKEYVAGKKPILPLLPSKITPSFLKKKIKKKVNVAAWLNDREDSKREIRKNAAEAFLGTLMDNGDVLATNLKNLLVVDTKIANLLNYDSAMTMRLDTENVCVEVYDNLVKGVGDNLSNTLHKYVSFEKKVLKLKEFRFYDFYAHLFPSNKVKVTYDNARENIALALKPLGGEYVNLFEYGSYPEYGRVDVYPNEGKKLHEGVITFYKNYPYVLLNYSNDFEYMFTMAHEFGHALNYYYTSQFQPFVYYMPATCSAEVAATTNEILLYNYLLRNAKNNKDKLFLYSSLLDKIKFRLIRLTQFAEFEEEIHRKIEKEEFLDLKTLNDIYVGLNTKYYGSDEYVPGEFDGIEWAFLVYSYRNFYVYNYAVAMAAAIELAKRFENTKTDSEQYLKNIEQYLDFLKAGSSAPPCEVLQKTGLDVGTPEAVQELVGRAMNYFAEVLGKVEELYNSTDEKN